MHEEKAHAEPINDVDDALLERLESRADPARRKLVRKFANATLRRRPHAQSTAADLDAVADRLVEAFEFFDARRLGEIAIRVANHAMPTSGHPEPCTVVEVAIEDRPFLLSTATEELRRLGHEVVHVLHPVIGVVRDDDGRLVDVVPARGATKREALLHLELDTPIPHEEHDELRRCVRAVLEDVIVVIRDESHMREKVERFAVELRARATTGEPNEEALEAAALLEWLLDDNFLPLGWREYEIVEDDDGPQARGAAVN
ncbi:MAG: NAD-glutamate dehydrogenase [Actinomycetota bacterium]|nr:NAD-glutamate dehydrogenase [Actinomycetota bacterium]